MANELNTTKGAQAINPFCYEIQRYKFPNLIPKLSIRGCDGP
jgi:hypothetical protein